MGSAFRHWWGNCYAPDDRSCLDDEEIGAIDALDDSIGPLDDETAHLRGLIGCFESCHHKTERHAQIIIEAIGAGCTSKGQGRREPGHITPREREYEALIEILGAWCAGRPAGAELRVGPYTGQELTDPMGERTPLKVWQVERVVEKVSRFLDPDERWTEAACEPVVDTEDDGADAEFRDATRRTVIHDSVDGEPAESPLAAAIDHLTGCNWDFPETIRTVLRAIGGELDPARPLALHARNIKRNPVRERMRIVSNSLRAFCRDDASEADVDADILRRLGARTPAKHWLAASLDKTLRLQLDM